MMVLSATLVFVALLQAPASVPPSDVVARAQAALTAMAANESGKVEEQFTPEMKAAMPPGRLAAMWASLLGRAGARKDCEANPRVRSIADKQMVITACEFERATIDIQFAFDSAGRISGM